MHRRRFGRVGDQHQGTSKPATATVHRRAVLGPAVAMCLLAAACGGATGEPAEEAAQERTMESLGLTAESGESGLDRAGEPQRGGSIVYGLEAETNGGFCLSSAQLAAAGQTVARAIYDPLTAPNGEGDYVPYLAETVTHSDDYRTWTLTLRPGITFHDGTPLTAEVVKNNLDAYRGVYPGRDSQLFALALDNIEAVTVTAPDTVEVTTGVPWVAFPAYLGGARLGMMAQAQLDDPESCARSPIGTGPFRFVSWTTNAKLVVERNEDYWQVAPDGEPYPYLDRIEFRPIPDLEVRTNALRAGDIDALHTSSVGTIVGDLRKMRDQGHANLFVSEVAAEVAFVMLNHTQPPFDDIRVRRALVMAIDRDKSNRTDNDGLGTIATGPFAPGTMGYLEDSGYPEFDVDEAKRLVAEYEAEGTEAQLTLSIANDPTIQTQAEALQQRLKTVGMEVDIEVQDQASLINDAIAKQYQAVFVRNFPGGDPDSLRVWWYSGTTAADGTFTPNLLNFPGTRDAEMDRLLDEGRSEPDPEVRKEIYEDLNRRMASQVVAAWTFYAPWGIAERPDVHDVLGPPLPRGGKGESSDGPDDDPARQPSANLSGGNPLLGMWKEQ